MMIYSAIIRLARACLLFSLIAISTISTVSATEIRLVNNDGANEGFNDSSAATPGQTGNTGTTLGEQRILVFQAAADYWEERLVSDVPIRVGINFDPLSCSAFSGTLGSAGPRGIFRDFPNRPLPNTWYVSAVADSLAGSDRSPSRVDIGATFNSAIDNNDNCLRNTNWWLGINSPAPRGTISLFDTVLHEIGHGLGVLSLVSQSGQLNGGFNDAYSNNLFDETTGQFWPQMDNAGRAASAVNTGNVTWRGVNADTNSSHVVQGKTNGHLRMFAPNPYQPGSSISHWDTALSPDELMEPRATPTSDDRSTLQLLKDVGWEIVESPAPNPGTIGLNAANVSVVENAGPAAIQLARTGGTDGAVSVLISTANGTATAGSDYTAINSQLVSWADGETGVRTVNVSIVDDGIDEGAGETLTLTLSSVTGGASLGRTETTLTINDPPSRGTIGLTTANVSVVEDASPAVIELSRTGGSDGAVSVLVNTTDGTALAGSDYVAINNQLVSWADGESGVRTVNVSVINDFIDEGVGETLTINLDGVTGGASLGRSSATLTITDPLDPGVVLLADSNVSVDENAGPAVIRLVRSVGSDGEVSVLVNTFDGTATAGSDYTSINDLRVSWADGEIGTRTVNVTVNNDGIVESGGETVTLSLSGGTGGVVVGAATTTLTINDPPARGTISMRADNVSIVENAGPAIIELERTSGTDGPVSVLVSTTNGSATAGSDYTSVSQRVSWADGESGIRTVNVSISNDGVDEGSGETLTLNLSGVTGGAALGRTSTTLTITDPPNPGSIGLVAANVSVVEDAGPAAIQLSRTGGSDGAVSVLVNTANGTASAGSDYTAISNQLVSWADGESGIRTVNVSIIDDAVDEGSGETLTLNLSGVTGGAALGRTSTTLTITDPPNLGSIGLVAANVSVVEDAGPAAIQLSRTGGSDGAVSVLVNTANGTASAGSDYTAISNQLVSWADGESGIRTVNVSIIDDGVDEGSGETLTLNLSGVSGGAALGRTSTTLTITDPPNPGSIGFIADSSRVNENAGSATLTVRRSGGSDGAVSVLVSSSDISAVAGLDYQSISNQAIEWADGESGDRTFDLTIIDDDVSEPGDEQLLLTLSNASNGASISRVSTTLTIVDTTGPAPMPEDDGFLLNLMPAILGAIQRKQQKEAAP